MKMYKRISGSLGAAQVPPLTGSFTIEAAFVVPITLFVIAALIRGGIRLHDSLVSGFTANEAAELYGHLPDDSDTESVSDYGKGRLGSLISGSEYELYIEKYKKGSVVSISGDGNDRSYTDAGFRPESFMRKITVIEEVFGND